MDAIEIALAEVGPATSLCLSSDDRYLLVNVVDEIHLWDLHRAQLQHRYRGHTQGRFAVRSAFIGDSESLIACGSDDSQVYVWHRHSGTLLQALPGHAGAINAVAWNTSSSMLATASDDHSIRVWTAPPRHS